jgi:hypothetical protein
MKHWYYALMTEEGINWSTAVQARSLEVAKRILADRFPHATIFNIER